MSLSFYYEFTAPAATSAEKLEEFLYELEEDAKTMGFAPTMVLNVPFDTPERQEFSFRLGGSFTVRDERLKGIALPAPGLLRNHDSISGEGRLIPKRGVVLVVTDEKGCESCFGFFRFPERVTDINGITLAETHLAGAWQFRDFVDSPDPRFRRIVQKFEASGYAKAIKDEFA